MKVQADVLGSPSLKVRTVSCGRKATLNSKSVSTELRSCVKVEVGVLGSPSLTARTVSCGRKATLNSKSLSPQSSEAV